MLFKKDGKKPKIICNAEGCGYERNVTDQDGQQNK